jgi:STE24 endopeptidase
LNLFLAGFLVIYLAQALFDFGLEILNLKYLDQNRSYIPQPFMGFIDESRLSRINAYTLERSRLGSVRSATAEVLLLILILSGFMPALETFMRSQSIPYMPAGLLFFFVPGIILYLFDLPFDYYRTFVVEEKFGFNRSPLRLWIIDHCRSGMLSIGLSSLVLLLMFWVIGKSPDYWWLWGFFIVSLVQITLALLYPILIAPIFNKFTPLEDDLLSEKIKRLMHERGIRVSKILQMDATSRSGHTNAYFTGLGKTKQIVLYDTLLQSHPHHEILAVLAHEMGHLKGRHILKGLLLSELAMFIGFYLTSQLMRLPGLYSALGFQFPAPYVGLFFVLIFWQKAGFFLKPLYLAWSRRFELKADCFAADLMQDPQPLATALKRMAADNLANLNPHPLYARFNYSHPPLVQRVATLEDMCMLYGPSSICQETSS